MARFIDEIIRLIIYIIRLIKWIVLMISNIIRFIRIILFILPMPRLMAVNGSCSAVQY